LLLIKDIFKSTVKELNNLDHADKERALKENDSFKILNEVADWIFINWAQMSTQVNSNRTVFDIC